HLLHAALVQGAEGLERWRQAQSLEALWQALEDTPAPCEIARQFGGDRVSVFGGGRHGVGGPEDQRGYEDTQARLMNKHGTLPILDVRLTAVLSLRYRRPA